MGVKEKSMSVTMGHFRLIVDISEYLLTISGHFLMILATFWAISLVFDHFGHCFLNLMGSFVTIFGLCFSPLQANL